MFVVPKNTKKGDPADLAFRKLLLQAVEARLAEHPHDPELQAAVARMKEQGYDGTA